MIHALAYLWNSPWYNTFSSNMFVTIFAASIQLQRHRETPGFWRMTWMDRIFFAGLGRKTLVWKKRTRTRNIAWFLGQYNSNPSELRHLVFYVFSLHDYMWFSEKILPLSNASQIISLHRATYSLEPMISAGNSWKPSFIACFCS